MAFTEEKFNKQLAVANIKLEEISELSNSSYVEDISLANEQIGALISRLEKSKDGTIDYLIETDKELEYIKQWTADQKVAIQPFREARYGIKKKLNEFTKDETQEALEKQLYVQQKVGEEQTKLKLQQQKEIEAAMIQQQQRERRMVLEKTRLRKTDRRNPSRVSGRRRFRKTRNVFNAIGKITKVHNLTLFR